jgi:hypothetical protein
LEDSDTDEDSDRDEDTTGDIEAEDYGTAGVTIGDASSLSLELSSSSVRANAEYQRALAEIDHLKKENSKLKENIKSLNESNAYYCRKSHHGESGADASNEPLAKRVCTEIQQALEKVRNKFRQVNIAKYGKHFANGLWSYLGDTLQPYVLKRVQKYYPHNVFTPFNVLGGMDLDSALSYEGVEVLRRVESGGKKYFRGLLPSSAELKRWVAKIEWFARGHFPYQLRSTSDGEAVRFDYAKTTKTVMKAFYLTEVAALQPVSVGFSIDGMSLSKNVDATISGIRVNDRSAQDPLTGQLILSDPSTMIAQSHTLCQPLELAIGRESTKFDEMSTVFEFMNKISKDETLPEELADFKAFATCVCCDMSAGWKGADKGGGAKQYEEPCHCCNLKSDHLAKPNEAHCMRWCGTMLLMIPTGSVITRT